MDTICQAVSEQSLGPLLDRQNTESSIYQESKLYKGKYKK